MPINVIFACPKCGSLYIAAHHAWSGAYDYPIWRPHEPLGARLVVQRGCSELQGIGGGGAAPRACKTPGRRGGPAEEERSCLPARRRRGGSVEREVRSPPPP